MTIPISTSGRASKLNAIFTIPQDAFNANENKLPKIIRNTIKRSKKSMD